MSKTGDVMGKEIRRLRVENASLRQRLEAAEGTAGLAVSLLREAFLFKGYGDGPLSHNAPAIQMVLRQFALAAGDGK